MGGGFRIEDWTVEPELNTLEREGHTLRLEPKVMQVLSCLADRQGQLVTKDQLIRAVWPDTFVTDDVLTRCISELRKALNDDPKQPRFVETISKGGYRLLPPVRQPAPATQTKAPRRLRRFLFLGLSAALVALIAVLLFAMSEQRPSWLSSLGRGQPSKIAPFPRSIAVLPMENLSEDASQEYFADGVTDELITNLAKIGSLRVISRTSVMQYKRAHQPLPDIARALHVELILTGSVVRSGDRVRITAQLVDGRSDSHLWAQEFERDLQNVLTLESDMAHEIAREIRVQLTKEDGDRLQPSHVVSSQAHDAYLRGRYLWSKKTFSLYRKASPCSRRPSPPTLTTRWPTLEWRTPTS
jgi:TolB-like protein/DNA-binding winged helix-turn-helix (wHTH) protein